MTATTNPDRDARNRRTGLILACIALGFFVAMFVRMAFFAH